MADQKYNEILQMLSNKVQVIPVTDNTKQTVAEEINIFIRTFKNLVEDVTSLSDYLIPKMRHLRWEILDTFAGELSPFIAIAELEVNEVSILPTLEYAWTSSAYWDDTRKPHKVADKDLTYNTGTFISATKTDTWLQADLGVLQSCKEWRILSASNLQPKNVRVYGSQVATPSVKTIGIDSPDWKLLSAVTMGDNRDAWSQFYRLG